MQGDGETFSWVTSYSIRTSLDGTSWLHYDPRVSSKPLSSTFHVATRLTAGDLVHTYCLSKPPLCRYVRVHPGSWEHSPSLRLELYVAKESTDIEDAEVFEEAVVKCQHLYPIGLANGTVLNARIKATSCFNTNHMPHFARLRGPSCWLPAAESFKSSDQHDWIQFDAGHICFIGAIYTQGSPVKRHWVMEFAVETSIDKTRWTPFANASGSKAFTANCNSNDIAVLRLQPMPLGRFVRIRPLVWHVAPGLRAEIWIQDCGWPLGLESGELPPSCISASSSANSVQGPNAARLHNDTAWVPLKDGEREFVQFNLQSYKLLSGVLLQGDNETNSWVTGYAIHTSLDGQQWTEYDPRASAEPLVSKFSVHVDVDDGDTVHAYALASPPLCRHVRILPRTWADAIAMRAELLVESIGLPAGLESGLLPDECLRSTSTVDELHLAQHARLNGNSCWQPQLVSTGTQPFIVVDLEKAMLLTLVLSQGSPSSDDRVTAFDLQSSLDGVVWSPPIAFSRCNTDSHSVAALDVPTRPYCRFVKLVPTAWHASPCWRLELIVSSLGLPVGLQDGSLVGAMITASSESDSQHACACVRLAHPTAWMPSTKIKSDSFVQIELDEYQLITAIQSQGAGDRPAWIKTFALETSLDGALWTPYTESGDLRRFAANSDQSSVVTNVLRSPTFCKFVKVWPGEFENAVALRLELISKKTVGRTLGIADRQLPDSAFSTSSFLNAQHAAAQCRLFEGSSTGAWIARPTDHSTWVCIDLKRLCRIGAILTRGCAELQAWVTSYSIQYSDDGQSWSPYSEHGSKRILPGNSDAVSIEGQVLDQSQHIIARFLRIIPASFEKACATSIDVLGFDLGNPIGMESRLMPDSAISATAVASDEYAPHFARLNNPAGCWKGTELSMEDLEDQDLPMPMHYIEAMLDEPQAITAILTQGHPVEPEWVTEFTLDTKLDEHDKWTPYLEHGHRKFFAANKWNQIMAKNVLSAPVIARYIRIRPTRWVVAPSLRFEALGRACGLPAKLNFFSATVDVPILASSAVDVEFKAANARLFHPEACWTASSQDPEPWIQVDLERPKLLRGLATQGNPVKTEFVTHYRVKYSLDGLVWHSVECMGKDLLPGNDDADTVHSNLFDAPVLARYVRVEPASWHAEPSLRMEVFASDVGQPLGLESGQLLDKSLSSSTMLHPKRAAKLGRLNNPHGCWSPSKTGQKTGEFMQIDVGQPVVVSAILTQGFPQPDNPKRGDWVTSYQLQTSLDAVTWLPYTRVAVKDLQGNTDATSIAVQVLPEAHRPIARYIRLTPRSHTGLPALRVEVIGLPCGTELGTSVPQQVSADRFSSSSDADAAHSASHAHLHGQTSWSPADPNERAYLQLDLGRPRVLSALLTQGDPAKGWVTAYKVEISDDGVTWEPTSSSDAIDADKEFFANTDGSTVVANRVPGAPVTRFVRLIPVSWQQAPCLRIEALVSDVPGEKTLHEMLSEALAHLEAAVNEVNDELSTHSVDARVKADLFDGLSAALLPSFESLLATANRIVGDLQTTAAALFAKTSAQVKDALSALPRSGAGSIVSEQSIAAALNSAKDAVVDMQRDLETMIRLAIDALPDFGAAQLSGAETIAVAQNQYNSSLARKPDQRVANSKVDDANAPVQDLLHECHQGDATAADARVAVSSLLQSVAELSSQNDAQTAATGTAFVELQRASTSTAEAIGKVHQVRCTTLECVRSYGLQDADRAIAALQEQADSLAVAFSWERDQASASARALTGAKRDLLPPCYSAACVSNPHPTSCYSPLCFRCMAVLGRSLARPQLKAKVSEADVAVFVAPEPVTVEEAILAATQRAVEPVSDHSPMQLQELASPKQPPPATPVAPIGKHDDANLLSKTIVLPPRQVLVSKKPETPEEASRRAAEWAARRAFKKTRVEELFVSECHLCGSDAPVAGSQNRKSTSTARRAWTTTCWL